MVKTIDFKLFNIDSMLSLLMSLVNLFFDSAVAVSRPFKGHGMSSRCHLSVNLFFFVPDSRPFQGHGMLS